MSKPSRARYRLSEVKAQYNEALGTEEGLVEFYGNNDELFTLTHPLFLKSEEQRAMAAAAEISSEEAVRAVLGAEQAQRYLDGGNDPDDIGLFLAALRNEQQEKAQTVRLKRC